MEPPGGEVMERLAPYLELHPANNTTMAHGQSTLDHLQALFPMLFFHFQCHITARDSLRHMTSILGQKLLLL